MWQLYSTVVPPFASKGSITAGKDSEDTAKAISWLLIQEPM